MTVHKSRTHHRPRVALLPLNDVWRVRLGHRWVTNCNCGHHYTGLSWHRVLIEAYRHAQEVL